MAEYNSDRVKSQSDPYVAFTDKHGGLKFVMADNNPNSRDIMKNGICEYNLIQWARQFLKDRPGTDFLDIGAHVGTWGCYLSDICNMVHSFEPQSATYRALNKSIDLNEMENIRTYQVALGNPKQEGEIMTLNIVSLDGGGSTLLDEAAVQAGSDYGNEKVKVRSLDSYELNNVGFIKIDVEGFELEVLEGARQTLKRNNWPKIIFEAWPDDWYKDKREELFNFFPTIGYKVVRIGGFDHMFIAEPI